MDRLYFHNWLNIAPEHRIARPGDHLTRSLGAENLLLVRDTEGQLRGFYNVCRHRGTRLIERPNGSDLTAIVCPYHAWTYSLDGRLIGAPQTRELTDFDRKDFGLYPIQVGTWGGFVWANLDPAAPPLRHALGEFFDRYERFSIGSLQLGAARTYEVGANWKLLVENYSECYHCAPVHPELNRITPYFTGENDAHFITAGPKRKFAGGYMTFAGDFTSMVPSGYTRRPPLRGMTEEDRKRVSYHVVFPNLFFSLHPDYLIDPSHVADLSRPFDRRERVLLRPRDHGAAGLRSERCRGPLGRDQPAGLEGVRAGAAGDAVADLERRPVQRPRVHGM